MRTLTHRTRLPVGDGPPGLPVPVRDAGGRWDLEEATACQRRLRRRVETRDRLAAVRYVAGADVSYNCRDPTLYAAVVLLDAQTLETVETASVVQRATFPYLPGYLSFREAPAVLAAFERLAGRADLLMVDGHGLAHPRGFGLACHVGLLLDLPTIGLAKSRLVGTAGEPGLRRGCSTSLIHGDREVGRVLRTRRGVKPVYVSTGHRVCLDTAVRLTLACASRYRIPEPTRRAHLAVNLLRLEHGRRKRRR